MNKKKLPDKLKKKRKPGALGLLAEVNPDYKEKLIVDEHLELLDLLCEYYGVEDDENKYLGLSYLLAYERFSGFHEGKKRGRGKKWSNEIMMILQIEMESIIESGNKFKGARYAAGLLAKKEPWKSFVKTRDSSLFSSVSEVLRQKYQSQKKKKNIDLQKLTNFKELKDKGNDDWSILIHEYIS